MTTSPPETTNWISVGALADSFAPDSNILARSDELAGKSFTLHTAEGGTMRCAFVTADALSWTASGPGVAESGSESYVATSPRPGIYFIDFVKAGSQPPCSVSIVADLAAGVATIVTGLLPAAAEAHASILRRAQARHELTSVGAHFAAATIDRPFDPAAPLHTPTTDLIGLRLQHRYNPHEVYEHIYLNEKRYVWHCLSGIEQGLADVDRCHYYRIAANLYLFVWREKIVPTLGAILLDLDRMKTTGKIFGYADDALSEVSNFQIGAYSTLLNRTEHAL
ncbi:MAG: molybdenum cofactor biosynthesis F family protein [Xanthobacteraceae bacterium]|nr:molybdenum cofactor biosynthesis F family protein [Xanthobacteraceae bacterium]